MEENKTIQTPSIILGLDISTACIGVSIILDKQDEEPEILEINHAIPKVPSKVKGIEALIMRKKNFERDYLYNIKDKINITECVIESPLIHITTGNSNANTVAQLLQFNGLISESIYDVFGIVPHYVTSYEARMMAFPELLAIRNFNKKGEKYDLKHVEKSIKENHLVLFGDFPFECDKKSIMMNCVCDKYPNINWVLNEKGELKKQNYDACDSLVCALAYANQKKHGEITPKIISSEKINSTDGRTKLNYIYKVWNKQYSKQITF